MSSFSTINPYTNTITHTHEHESIADIDQKISQLSDGFCHWKTSSVIEKKEILTQLALFLTQEADHLAMMISTDMGKPVKESVREVQKCIECCHHYHHQLDTIHQSMTHPKGIRQPLGIILSILPWNYPLWQLIRAVVPSLAAGNVFLVKPATNTYRIANHLSAFFNSLPHQLLCICIPTDATIHELIEHDAIAGVSFTGSLSTGRKVGACASANIKPCVLELGGSDPFIVFDDAPLETAIGRAVHARFTNAGQVCIAGKRFLFHHAIYSEALALFAKKTDEWAQYGNPTHPNTTLGPLARIDIKNKLNQQLSSANILPDHVVYKQPIDAPSGNAFPCMIIDATHLPKTSTVFTEELFGPVAICDSFTSTDDAILKANATPYGLGASIWTTNSSIMDACTTAIDCGALAINSTVHTHFDTPFGGRKKSGLGLELGLEGAHSFTGFKSVLKF